MKRFHFDFIFLKSFFKLLSFVAMFVVSRRIPADFSEFVVATSSLALVAGTLSNAFIISSIHGKKEPLQYFPGFLCILFFLLSPALLFRSGTVLYFYLFSMYTWDFLEAALFRAGYKITKWIFIFQKTTIFLFLIFFTKSLTALYLAYGAPMFLSVIFAFLTVKDVARAFTKLNLPPGFIKGITTQATEVFTFNFPPAIFPVVYGKEAMESVSFMWFLYRTIPPSLNEFLRVVSGTFLEEILKFSKIFPIMAAVLLPTLFLKKYVIPSTIILASLVVVKKYILAEKRKHIHLLYLPVVVLSVTGALLGKLVEILYLGFLLSLLL